MARIAVLTLLGLGLASTPASAQANEACRCVDRDGNEIERCTCFRSPRLDTFMGPGLWSDARPRLGISVDVNQSARRDAVGVLVTDVLEDGPADEAGLRRGDLITAIDGRSLFEPLASDVEERFDLDRSIPVQRLVAVTSEIEPGQRVEIEYVRGEESRTAALEAEELADAWRPAIALPGFDADRMREQLRGFSERGRVFERDHPEPDVRVRAPRGDVRFRFEAPPRGDVRVFGGGDAPFVLDRLRRAGFGLRLVELNPALGAYFGVEEGVLVADVAEGSSLGLEPGDVVLRIGDREITTPERMQRILRSYGDDEDITLHVRRQGREIEVVGRLSG